MAGAYGGSAWEPLNASTMEKYDRERWGDTLGGRGGMWESLTSSAGPNAFEELTSDGQSLRVGSLDPVADFFNYGTRKQPARPFFPDGGELPPALVEQLEEIVARHLADPWRDLG